MYRWYGLIFLAFALAGCSKGDDAAPLAGDWKILRIHPDGERARRSSADYILRLRIDGVYGLNLDVNTCGGPYVTDGAGRVDFAGVSCTEKCCDSSFAQRLVLLMGDDLRYRIEKNKLILSGAGGIVEAKRV